MKKSVKIMVVIVLFVGIATVWMLKNKPFDRNDEKVNNISALDEGGQEELKKEEDSGKDNEAENVSADLNNAEEMPEPSKEIRQEEPLKEEVLVDLVKEEEKTAISENLSEKEEKLSEEQNLVEEEKIAEEVLTEEDKPQADVVLPELVATEFDLAKLKSYNLPIMIEFGASWCTWCRWMEPTLKELNNEYAGKVIIQSVDVEKFRNEVSEFNVSLLPTIYFFDAEGNVFETHVGAMTKEDILKVFESMGVKK